MQKRFLCFTGRLFDDLHQAMHAVDNSPSTQVCYSSTLVHTLVA